MSDVTLYHGGCLEIMLTLPDKSIDMILADLPYQMTQLKWDTIIPFEGLWREYKRVIKDNGAIVLFASQPFTSALVMSNPDDFRYELIWDKGRGSNPLLAKKMPMRGHENMLVFYKHLPTYNPQFEEGRPYKAPRTGGRNSRNTIIGNAKDNKDFRQEDNNGYRYPLSIIKASIHNGSKLHPTQKPVELMEYLIRTYTSESETVLDNVMGSGTTGVACIKTNRNFIGIEKAESYFKIAQQRIAEAQAQPALLNV